MIETGATLALQDEIDAKLPQRAAKPPAITTRPPKPLPSPNRPSRQRHLPRARQPPSVRIPVPWSVPCKAATACMWNWPRKLSEASRRFPPLPGKLGVDLGQVRPSADGVVTLKDVALRKPEAPNSDRACRAGARCGSGSNTTGRRTYSRAAHGAVGIRQADAHHATGLIRRWPARTTPGRTPQHGAGDGRRSRAVVPTTLSDGP